MTQYYHYLPCVKCGVACLDHRKIDYVAAKIGEIEVLCFDCSTRFMLMPVVRPHLKDLIKRVEAIEEKDK